MTNDRVDHAAEAARVMGKAHDNADQDNRWRSEHQMKRAQVHATLALVEQQRIANLIALGQYTIVPGEMPTFRGVIFEGDYLRPDIAAALGLTDGADR